ncbi:MAG: cytidylate kinase-like family protein [Acidimicrobiia bacterium]|nr:cytidylate kinase-like family protein [Acidimicrobiia bacterium]
MTRIRAPAPSSGRGALAITASWACSGGMSQVENLERYLRAHLAAVSSGREVGNGGVAPFITISRQAGAGGRALADRLVEVFESYSEDLFSGWQVFDRRLCELVAEDPKMSQALDSLLAEEYHSAAGAFFRSAFAPDQDVVMARVFEVVRSVAFAGKAVIVGRAGSQVSRDLDQGVHIRLVAPMRVRVQRIALRDGLDERSARELTRRTDAHRARLLKARFDVDIEDPTNYDVTWNTDAADLDEVAAAVATLVRNRAGSPRTG